MHKMRLLALLGAMPLTGCNDTRYLAPPSHETPWQIDMVKPDTAPIARQAAVPSASPRRFELPRDPAQPWADDPVDVDLTHAYALDELIDIAQRRNKTTRIAWEQARQAAIGVGLARAAYLPQLTLSALGGYQHTALPLPPRLAPRGYITSNQEEIFPEIALKYLLLDFGGAKAETDIAKQLSYAANVLFTGMHQKLIFDVSRAYFMLDGVNAQVRAAQQSLANARVVQSSAETKLARGEGTVTEVALARRGVAQATFDLAQATSSQDTARYALLQQLALPPTTLVRVVDSSDRPLQRSVGKTVDQLMQEALQQRPDLLASLSQLRSKDAGIALARSEFFPKLSASVNVQGNIGQVSTDGSPYQRITQPQAGVFLRFDWPLYDGGARGNRLHIAQSQRAQAEDSLQQNNEQALREVAMAYNQVETGLVQYDAAIKLRTASELAYQAAVEAFAHGVGTLTDATNAQAALASARASVARTHSQCLIDAAGLAFAMGELTSSAAARISAPSESPAGTGTSGLRIPNFGKPLPFPPRPAIPRP